MSSNLPPYSTFRTDPKGQQTMFPHTKSFGNVLTFTPPGFKQSLNVKFPDARLPVCVSCKKNFKTKDMCRVRNLHTRPPWTTAYICMTLDASCTDEDGKYVDKPFVVRMAGWRPFNVMEDFPANSKTPVCATCKKTNRTRSFCRDRHKHRKLPWCTVYVMLSTQESADPSTIVAAPSTKIETAKDSDAENNQGKINTSTLPSVKIESNKTDAQNSSLETPVESNKDGESTKDPSDANKPSSKTTGDDINDIPESRTMLIQINDEETTIKWLQLAHENDKGAWVPPPQLSPQQPKAMPPGIIQSAQKYSYPPVAPATMRGSKREADSSIGDPSQDPYHQHAMTGYNTAMGQPLAPALPHPYSYGRTAQQYIGHTWPYPTASIPPQPRQSMPHPYVTGQHRPISPAPAIGSPGGHMIGAPSLSPAVTAGEAAAMRRKKPRRDFEAEDKAESHHLHLHPTHPSPPPPPPAPIVPQLHHQAVNYSHVPLAPGPPLMHQPPQHPPGQIHHQEQQPWMVYQQMYQAQLQPVKNQYTTEPPRMTVRTPESTSRKFHQHDESPNNVTMTPGPGDGGGDHDSDDNDFNRQNEL
eukprot:CAMPEP_0116129188 /NCGR_PEP_ID=MMETSP0329-20121206/7795_1 /TAXON_ID=697910 /ORGANISM="Pseudo-nitzschia arenysensis, Strain B593" /LENGTH=583 /DNA_ID=CAMNT_0003623447 /DNA_START=82 /DNA_END=1833 /DNA_ORIENTATION=+